MNNRNKWIVGVVVVIIIGWILIARGKTPAQENGTTPSTNATEQTTQNNPGDVTRPVSTTTYSYDGEDGKTALELLRVKYQGVETEKSDYGEFVTSIDSQKADPTKEYWAFYVNGDLSSVGADTYQTKAGDKIEWKLELL